VSNATFNAIVMRYSDKDRRVTVATRLQLSCNTAATYLSVSVYVNLQAIE